MQFFSSLAFCIVAVQAIPTNSIKPYTLYAATYSGFIHTLSFDPSIGNVNDSLKIVASSNHSGFEPGWLVLRDKILYSVSRSNFTSPSDPNGGLFSFETSPNKLLKLISNATTAGLGGVAFDFSPDGKTLAVANIDGSSISIHPHDKGHISPPSLVFHYNLTTPGPGLDDSQDIPNPHEAVFTPSGKHIIVCDRGSDRLYVYRHRSPFDVSLVANISLPLGTGARHAIFRQYGQQTNMYLVSELDNSIRTWVLDESVPPNEVQDKLLTLAQRLSTLGPDIPRTPPNNTNLAAELQLSSSGRFLYISQRNQQFSVPSDNIAIFTIDQKSGELSWLGKNNTLGKIPRHFSLSPGTENKYLAVANQVTQNIEVFERDEESGFLGKRVGGLVLGDLDISTKLGPVAVIWG